MLANALFCSGTLAIVGAAFLVWLPLGIFLLGVFLVFLGLAAG